MRQKEKQALEQIKKICEANPYIETCGFLGFCLETKEYVIQEEKNISDNPKAYFMIDPLNYLLFKDKYDLIGIFHSHIYGDEYPSEFDMKMSDNCLKSFIIYSLNTKKIFIYTPKYTELDVYIHRFKKKNDKNMPPRIPRP